MDATQAQTPRAARFRQIIARVEYVRVTLGLNKTRFSARVGLTPQTYNNFIGAQGSKPSVELLLGCVGELRVNCGWLLFGHGAMFQEGAEPPTKDAVAGIAEASTSAIVERIEALEYQVDVLRRMAGPEYVRLATADAYARDHVPAPGGAS